MNQLAQMERLTEANRIFWPRMSEVMGDLAEAVQRPPEQPLEDGEKAEVLQFEKELMAGRYGEITSEISLNETPSSVDTAYRVAPSYFATPNGRQALLEFFPDAANLPQDTDPKIILRSIPIVLLDTNQSKLKTMAGDSMRNAKARYAEAALKEENIEDIPTIEINRDPNILILRLAGNLANRRFIRQVRARLQTEISNEYTPTAEAKLVVTDIYRDKINSVIAELYPGLQQLLLQVDAQPEEERVTYEPNLEGIRPLVHIARTALRSIGVQANFVRRLDYVRNGATFDAEGRLTTIDARIFEDANAINSESEDAESITPIFSSDEIAQLDKLVVDAETMKQLSLEYMQRVGIQGWDVDIRTDVDTLSVDGVNKKVKIPQSFKRTPTQTTPTAGVVPLIWHEIGGEKPGHVMQHLNAEHDDFALRIGVHPKYKGKRVTSVRETGGITAEAASLRDFFGIERKAKIGFAKSMEVIQKGGSVSLAIAANILATEAVEGDISSLDEKQKTTKYKAAADAVLRLTRFGGFNSQPLVYVESATGRRLLENVSDEIEKVILAEGIFDPVDMLRLHRHGLLVTSTEHLFEPIESPRRVMEQLLRELLTKNIEQTTV